MNNSKDDYVEEMVAKKPEETKKKHGDPLKDDPNAPRKPIMQGYLLFYIDVRSEKRTQYPEITNQELTSMICAEWNSMPKELITSYELRAKENREKYLKELEVYLNKTRKIREELNIYNTPRKLFAKPEENIPSKKTNSRQVLSSSESGSSSDSSDEDDNPQKKVKK